MPLKPDEHARKALTQVSPVVQKVLADDLLTVLDQLVDVSDEGTLRQLQGRARLLRELLNLIEGTPPSATRPGTR